MLYKIINPVVKNQGDNSSNSSGVNCGFLDSEEIPGLPARWNHSIFQVICSFHFPGNTFILFSR
jgi:hypothetical protein